MRVTVNQDVCVGAGMCALTAPRVFDQDEAGVVTLLVAEPGDEEARATAREAGTLCPSGAVRIIEQATS
ncbi:(4Fe-4S)-binding protein [Streptomyces sp. NPDC095613]|uniref:ferredoxin n=1 Tax=Streptomyces sp. NPDC095613 TaxID=3155540 RepID=UPI003323A4E8